MSLLDSFIRHVGTPHDGATPHSGRYKYGSGDQSYQHEGGFREQVSNLRKEGYSDTEIARKMGMSSTQWRERLTYESSMEKLANQNRARKLREKGYSTTAIGRMMGVNESTVRGWINNDNISKKVVQQEELRNNLKAEVSKYKYLDVGEGTELTLGVSETKKDAAIRDLVDSGEYAIHSIKIEQNGNPNHFTTMKVLTKADVTWTDTMRNIKDVMPVGGYTKLEDGSSSLGVHYPESIDSGRVYIRYREDGGLERDGSIDLRPGVKDISLNGSSISQVRIMVDGTHYMKGVAKYSDEVPDGYDIVYNTNKKLGTPPKDVFKPLKRIEEGPKRGEIDVDNPFGATIKSMNKGGQYYYEDENGNQRLSKINKVNDEGDWNDWGRSVPTQMLSKQPVPLIQRQLNLTYKDKEAQYKDILSISNPVIRQHMLMDFADSCEGASVHMKAMAFPGQATKVIVPFPSVKENEIYAPDYENGTKVALVRFPHAGQFEIPILTVNNNNADAKKGLGTHPIDSVGINAKAAERLSGADFDGDTVLVIPNNDGYIHNKPAREALKDFDTKSYKFTDEQCIKKANDILKQKKPKTDAAKDLKAKVQSGYSPTNEELIELGMKGLTISHQHMQREMGVVSNLITDMTIRGASLDEIDRAVKHSMVVIDSEKHHLDYNRSFRENDIQSLKEKYQDGGASTLISRAKRDMKIYERQDTHRIDEFGQKIYKDSTKTHKDKNGNIVRNMMDISELAYVKDANELSSGSRIESVYAGYSNDMKALSGKARLAAYAIDTPKVNKSAVDIYSVEVESLDRKLKAALANAPKERLAQRQATAVYRAKKLEKPDMSYADKKKVKGQALAKQRDLVGAKKPKITITDREWAAIEAGAIPATKVKKILANSKSEDIMRYALPRNKTGLTRSSESLAKTLARNGYSTVEIARRFDCSPSTISKILNEK